MSAKRLVLESLRRIGFDLRRAQYRRGEDAFVDIAHLLEGMKHPVVLDIGANVGQSVTRFKELLNNPTVHAFEPGVATFAELSSRTAHLDGVFLVKSAVGALTGSAMFLQNSNSDLSSILDPGPDCWGTITDTRIVPVTTVDAYCAEANIRCIDVLKTDTQGFDLEVLRGAKRLLAANLVKIVHIELVFSQLYKDLPAPHDILMFMCDNRFDLVSIYPFVYQHGRAGWADAVFINRL